MTTNQPFNFTVFTNAFAALKAARADEHSLTILTDRKTGDLLKKGYARMCYYRMRHEDRHKRWLERKSPCEKSPS